MKRTEHRDTPESLIDRAQPSCNFEPMGIGGPMRISSPRRDAARLQAIHGLAMQERDTMQNLAHARADQIVELEADAEGLRERLDRLGLFIVTLAGGYGIDTGGRSDSELSALREISELLGKHRSFFESTQRFLAQALHPDKWVKDENGPCYFKGDHRDLHSIIFAVVDGLGGILKSERAISCNGEKTEGGYARE